MADEKKKREEAQFTVRDRRLFTPEGELREEFREEEPTRPPALATPSKVEAGTEPTTQQRASDTARKEFARQGPPREYKPDFTQLIVSLATTAMYQLGLVRDPKGPAPPLDLDAARHTIDMLGVIEEKTRANLTAEEQQLLDQSLYDLRMSFLAILKTVQEKKK